MPGINTWLCHHHLRIDSNPCISPDYCLDWPALRALIQAADPQVRVWEESHFCTAQGSFFLLEGPHGDCAWLQVGPHLAPLAEGAELAPGRYIFPASWNNLLILKNLIQEYHPESTVFPSTAGTLAQGTLGIGARFTTLHWPAVDWTMAHLGLSLTANQNSIPRELVYSTQAMLEGRLGSVPFPFIGCAVPEGHQGQSVEGMSHGCVLEKLRHGFHQHGIPWAFNADHQPVGGAFDAREPELVQGCLLASYITFDLSPELALGRRADVASLPQELVQRVRSRLADLDLRLSEEAFAQQLGLLWPALHKMQTRDRLYQAARAAAFTTAQGRAYLRELSIDELPGLTDPRTTALALACCEALDMPVHYVAPALGFQKNLPFSDNAVLAERVKAQQAVCERFGVGMGFHSGSGKSAENYQVLGRITGSRLEIKTSGRYTYEMGRALSQSTDPKDQTLWRDWYDFTRAMALSGAWSEDTQARALARGFILQSLPAGTHAAEIFAEESATRRALEQLKPSPEHPLWFEYNFLYVLAAGGRAEKSALGDHSPAGYRQRARLYAVSEQTRLRYLKQVAEYILFLAEHTGLATAQRVAGARARLSALTSVQEFTSAIAPSAVREGLNRGLAAAGVANMARPPVH